MPIRNIDEFRAAQEYFDDPATPPDAIEKLRASMAAFSRAQSGEVDLSGLEQERGAAEGPSLNDQIPPVDTPANMASGNAKPLPSVKSAPPRSGSGILPSHLGGSVEQVLDPSFNEFLRQRGAQYAGDADLFNAIRSAGTKSPEYQAFANELWDRKVAEAQTSGRSVQRLKADLGSTYEPDASLPARAAELGGQLLDTASGFANAGADSGALVVPGAGTALAGATGEADNFRQQQERHPAAAFVGSVAGSLAPQNLVGLVARGGYGALKKAAGYIAPKAEGLLALGGRTVGSGVASGAAALGEGELRDAANQYAYPDEAQAPDRMRRFIEGSVMGAGANLAGEGARAVSDMTRNAHPEISGSATGEGQATSAEAMGVRPGIVNLQATRNSPARQLESQRIAQGDETLRQTAVGNAAPRVADAASEQNAAMLKQSAGETAAIHQKLATAGVAPPPRPRVEQQGARQTLPPGRGDAEADAFGRIAREQGENQASLLGVQQAKLNGAPVTPPPVPAPLKVSTGPIAEATIGIIERRADPRTGQSHAFFNDADLRKELPKIFDVEVLPLEEAAQRAKAEGGWVQPIDRLIQVGVLDESIPMSQGKVGYLRPKELDSRQFDELTQVLQHKAKLDGNLQPDPRYGELAAVATKTRGEFPGLNELNTQQSQRFDQYKERAEGAGLRVGKNKEVPDYASTPHNDKAALHNALAQHRAAGRNEGARLRDQHFEAIASAGGPEIKKALDAIPMANSVDELRKAMLPTVQGSLGVGGLGRVAGSALVRLNPTLRAMGSVPDIQALGEKLNPQLKEVLRRMRLRPSVSKVGVAALSGRIGLRGGVAGARGAQVRSEQKEDEPITREDLENLLKLKRATQRAPQ